MTRRHLACLSLAALIFVWLHAWTVPRTLEDEDSVNMALGVEDFDVARYAPHPPGYPVYIALAKGSTATVRWLQPDWSRDRRAAAGLAWLSILAGAAGLFAVAALWRGLGVSPGWATVAAIGTAAAPLYWFTASRPLTDVPGLVAGVAVQAALLHGLRQRSVHTSLPLALVIGSLGAGVAIGLRSQTMWMTLPLLTLVCGSLLWHRQWRHTLVLSAVSMVGVLIWFVPLVHLTGGLTEYLTILRGQGQHDFSGVQMLATTPNWTVLRSGLEYTLLAPWQLTTLPWVIVAMACVGLGRIVSGDRRTSVLLLVLTVPYMAFHLLFHEVESVRYALPTVTVVAGLAVLALGYLGTRGGRLAAVSAAVASVLMVHPVTTTYATGAPVFRVIDDIRAARPLQPAPPRLEAHHRAWWATSRALDWTSRAGWDLAAPHLVDTHESLRLVEYWRSGATAPLWFLSDPQREDLGRFDPASAMHMQTYRWPIGVATMIGGRRAYDVGWWQLTQPQWMLATGWATTSELASERSDPHRATAFVRRHDAATMVMVGVRHLDTVPAPVTVTATVDGYEVESWVLESGGGVVRWLTLPADWLSGQDPYATIVLSAHPPTGTTERVVAFDQFDAKPITTPMLGLGRGWSSVVADQRVPGRHWRQKAGTAEIEVLETGQSVRLTIEGELPDTFEQGRPVLILAGDHLLNRFVADGSFHRSVVITPEILRDAGGRISIITDLRRTPNERLKGVQRRQFGLRVSNITVTQDDD
ncbi:MAG: hypothetical protein O2917_06945 [Acidobacteria bacterium]|nr:hypothetical protein [Acidobacteriota bacterium]